MAHLARCCLMPIMTPAIRGVSIDLQLLSAIIRLVYTSARIAHLATDSGVLYVEVHTLETHPSRDHQDHVRIFYQTQDL
jgi:hypothetical protein